MVRHGTAKKRRRGVVVSRKTVKNKGLKIFNKVRNPLVKENYDKKLSPSENLRNLGLEPNANNLECCKSDANPDPKFKAFVGFTEVEKTPKIHKLDEFQIHYAKTCIDKYGEDYEAMSRDIKINYNQMTVSKLKKLCNSYRQQLEYMDDDE